MPYWLQFPLIVAPSSDRSVEANYAISDDFIGGHTGIGRRPPFFRRGRTLLASSRQ